MSQVTWKDEPEEHDFPAASDIPCRLADATGTTSGRRAP